MEEISFKKNILEIYLLYGKEVPLFFLYDFIFRFIFCSKHNILF